MLSQEVFLLTSILLTIVILFCVGCACWKPAEHFHQTAVVDDGGAAAYVPWREGGEADGGPWSAASEPPASPEPAASEPPASSLEEGPALGSILQSAALQGSPALGAPAQEPRLEPAAAPAPAPAPPASSKPVEAFAGDSFCLW